MVKERGGELIGEETDMAIRMPSLWLLYEPEVLGKRSPFLLFGG